LVTLLSKSPTEAPQVTITPSTTPTPAPKKPHDCLRRKVKRVIRGELRRIIREDTKRVTMEELKKRNSA
ncbi:hypothetical protein L211DRAFT_835498, partial [Terfezia boudieri ATCC MYA-4762]